MIKGMFGCLFILIFGFIFLLLGVFRMLYRMLFNHPQHPYGRKRPETQANQGPHAGSKQSAYTNSRPGDAHHEKARPNSRQRRSGKIFEKSEGEYVDFEEV